MKSSLYILLKLLNTCVSFVPLPTNLLVFDPAYIICTSLISWSNLSYTKLLPTLILLFINQK